MNVDSVNTDRESGLEDEIVENFNPIAVTLGYLDQRGVDERTVAAIRQYLAYWHETPQSANAFDAAGRLEDFSYFLHNHGLVITKD